jgi:hypothetical protein
MTSEGKAIYVATGLLKAADMAEAACLHVYRNAALNDSQRRLVQDELTKLAMRLRSAASEQRPEAKLKDNQLAPEGYVPSASERVDSPQKDDLRSFEGLGEQSPAFKPVQGHQRSHPTNSIELYEQHREQRRKEARLLEAAPAMAAAINRVRALLAQFRYENDELNVAMVRRALDGDAADLKDAAPSPLAQSRCQG